MFDVVELYVEITLGLGFIQKDIENYIKKETRYCVVLNPFKDNPFPDMLVKSLLNSVPKSGYAE